MYRVLDFAQRWVSRGDWSTVDAGLSYARVTNALIDARNAESARVHLEVPAWSATGTPTSSGNAAQQGARPDFPVDETQLHLAQATRCAELVRRN